MLLKKAYENFTTNEIEPRGWLLRELRLQADGLSGHLQEVWPDIADSQWIGGKAEGWERVPYWLDGFIPLAYLLKDEKLIADAKKYVDFILSHQISDDAHWHDGWICPCKDDLEIENFDVWAVFLICKALIVYYECSNDDRIPNVIYRALKNLRFHMHHFGLRAWGSYRWYEAMIAINWTYDRTPENWLIEMAHNLCQQGADYGKIMHYGEWKAPKDMWTLGTHVVNLAMAIKSEALYFGVRAHDGEPVDPDDFAERMYETLLKYNGNGIGHFNGDECVSGTSPVHGTELCGVVEAMYSYEWMYLITGKEKWLERAEELAFNSLPAGISEDMWVRQYNQQVNQIYCGKYPVDMRPYLTNGIDGGLFGLEPNYGCCTANFNQGWPKFALSTFAKSERGISAGVIAPSAIRTSIDGANVEISLDTDYPFKGSLKYTVKTDRPVEFDFEYRIPAGVSSAVVNGEEKSIGKHTISKTWDGETTIDIELCFEARFKQLERGLNILYRGPVAFALPLEENWEIVEYEDMGIVRKFPYCDYILTRKNDDWQYGFAESAVEFVERDSFDLPFTRAEAPVVARVRLAPINWGYKEGFDGTVARDEPLERRAVGEARTLELLPYGIPKLRMTALPFVEKEGK